MKTPKSTKQKEIYEFIKEQISNKGYPPTIREICRAVGLSSTSTVYGHLERLEKKGLIKRNAASPRSIEVVENSLNKKEMIDVPVIGDTTDVNSILSLENIADTFPLPADFVKNHNKLFILKNNDKSMIKINILDGDFCIIEKIESVKNGDIVVAALDTEVTIKRFFKENNHIKLQPENTSMKPLMVDDCKIIGKLVGTYRSY